VAIYLTLSVSFDARRLESSAMRFGDERTRSLPRGSMAMLPIARAEYLLQPTSRDERSFVTTGTESSEPEGGAGQKHLEYRELKNRSPPPQGPSSVRDK
jgi:hypothetical protein